MHVVSDFYYYLCNSSIIFTISCLVVIGAAGVGLQVWMQEIKNNTPEDKIKKIAVALALIASLAIAASGGPYALRNQAAKEKLIQLIGNFQDTISPESKKWVIQQLSTLQIDNYAPSSDPDDRHN